MRALDFPTGTYLNVGRQRLGFERGAMISAVIRRPSLLLEAVRAWFAMSSRGRLTPDPVYLQWRAYTAYGDHAAAANARDLSHYLTWRREMRGLRRWGTAG